MDILRWGIPLPLAADVRANAVGLRRLGEPLIKAYCPPNFATMDAAVDAVLEEKFGPDGIYSDQALFARIFKGEFGAAYLAEASNYADDVIACVRDVCNYVYDTHGRFPAHTEAIHVPGAWIQVHHVDRTYYETHFHGGLTEAHRAHDDLWHLGASRTTRGGPDDHP